MKCINENKIYQRVNLFMNEVFNGNSNFKIIKDLWERLAGNKADKNTEKIFNINKNL